MWHKTTADWFATITKKTGEVLPFKMLTGGAVISTAQQTLTHGDSLHVHIIYNYAHHLQLDAQT